ncbi:hypothetical protein Y032_0146g2543 [Ancylostoma ceylanicum]|uniref:Uncharacterized protein n=1 Tax=Ancylostoma ceylanicum TaxID=53326 RepID=A0A016T2E9_9BILA|nr:hypothetical protein Y032_0146g2543 [Ancylostoma ceylanicum]
MLAATTSVRILMQARNTIREGEQQVMFVCSNAGRGMFGIGQRAYLQGSTYQTKTKQIKTKEASDAFYWSV